MASSSSLSAFFGRLTMHAPVYTRATTTTILPTITATRSFSSSAPSLARTGPPATKANPKAAAMKAAKAKMESKAKARKGRSAQQSENFLRIKTLRQNMFSPAPPPLRMARQRYLRHWTIHRAWQLFRRQQREQTAKERSRMHAGMYNACEELRSTVGPAERGEGYLYRVAMEKKGVYGVDAVPIEYARLQTDSPAKKAWDHEWKRS